MGNKQLADKLIQIALGNDFSESVLWEAFKHPCVTHNQSKVIWRYMYGTQNDTDHIDLQQIAIYIKEWK